MQDQKKILNTTEQNKASDEIQKETNQSIQPTNSPDQEGTTCGAGIMNSIYSFFHKIGYGIDRAAAWLDSQPGGGGEGHMPGM